jgi:hypothetical protein
MSSKISSATLAELIFLTDGGRYSRPHPDMLGLPAALNPESGENAAYQKARTALDRFGRPEEIAALIVWARWPLPHGFRKPILCLALSVSPTKANGLIGDH